MIVSIVIMSLYDIVRNKVMLNLCQAVIFLFNNEKSGPVKLQFI